MILIDAIYINNGGGKVLLDYLIKTIETLKIEVCYLLDYRVKNKIQTVKSSNKTIYLKSSIISRYLFYKTNKYKFVNILCFGNLPPFFQTNSNVYTYFHNPMLLNVPKEFTLIEIIKFQLKINILKQLTKNSSFWLVQSNMIKENFQTKFKISPDKVQVLPFYEEFSCIQEDIIREKASFIYVSNGTPHKNHERLIEVFCQFYDLNKIGKLVLTINEDYPAINELILFKLNQGYPIENIGYVDRKTLQKNYLKSEYLIFPSLTESFGLGLIEAIECGCKVIGADLPYTYEVCEPSLVFNPWETESILKAFEESLNDNINPTIPKIKNNINLLINLLNDNTCN